MKKLVKTFRIAKEIFEMLVRQAAEARRSQAEQIEFLILQEEKKRSADK